MKRTDFLLATAVVLTSFFCTAACAKKSVSYAMQDAAAVEAEGAYNTSFSTASAKLASRGEVPAAPAPAPAEPDFERKLIRTGSVSLEVQNLADTKAAVEAWVKKYGGYVANSSEWRNGISMTVKIPSRSFEQAMGETSGFGKVKSKNVNSQDVTEQFYDLKTRLETKQVMLERLENYLKGAKDIKDLIEIESKINEVTADLESMQGQMNRLSSQIDFSEISVDARLPANQNESGFVLPDAGNSFREFLYNLANFFVGFFFAVLYVVIFGVPIVLVLALLYWICFGKIGLIRKLYNKLKK